MKKLMYKTLAYLSQKSRTYLIKNVAQIKIESWVLEPTGQLNVSYKCCFGKKDGIFGYHTAVTAYVEKWAWDFYDLSDGDFRKEYFNKLKDITETDLQWVAFRDIINKM